MSASNILKDMANTYEQRNEEYGNNFLMVAPVMTALFPNGIRISGKEWTNFHLFMMIIVKLTRFVASGGKHSDSIHDIGVYAAMIESELWKAEAEEAGL